MLALSMCECQRTTQNELSQRGYTVSCTLRGMDGERAEPREIGDQGDRWDATRVRALRDWLDDSQTELADRLGTRQQTVSEWETGSSQPRRMSRRLLHLVAEESGFYDASRHDEGDNKSAGDEQHDND